MDYERLFDAADRSRARQRLSPDDIFFLRETVPGELDDFPHVKPPAKLAHPGGFSISGAPVGTFLRSALLLAGQKALGRRYAGLPFYEHVESDLALRIMRSHFHHGYPKGTHCCAQCTLAVLPVLEAGAIRYFDGRALAKTVRRIVEKKAWRFRSAPNAKMLDWALSR
jgi:hypothetical protein